MYVPGIPCCTWYKQYKRISLCSVTLMIFVRAARSSRQSSTWSLEMQQFQVSNAKCLGL